MKFISLCLLSLVISVVLIALPACVLNETWLFSVAFAADGPVARITAMTGDVTCKTDDGGEWKKASVTEPLFEGAYLMTAFESSCDLEFSDGSKMAVKELSKIQINKYSTGLKTVDTQLSLYNGSVRATVHKDVDVNTQFKVKTPVSTISVRGTEKEIDSYPGFGTQVRTISGIVEVQNNLGQSVTIQKDENTDVRGAGNEAPVTLATLFKEAARIHFKNEFLTKDERGITLDLSIPRIEAKIDEVVSVVEEFTKVGEINIRWK